MINLFKGQKVNLTKDNPGLSRILVGLGWDVNKYDGGSAFDLDASAFLLDTKEKVISEDWFVFYSQPQSPDRSVVYNMNDAVYEKSFDIDLNKLRICTKTT